MCVLPLPARSCLLIGYKSSDVFLEHCLKRLSVPELQLVLYVLVKLLKCHAKNRERSGKARAQWPTPNTLLPAFASVHTAALFAARLVLPHSTGFIVVFVALQVMDWVRMVVDAHFPSLVVSSASDSAMLALLEVRFACLCGCAPASSLVPCFCAAVPARACGPGSRALRVHRNAARPRCAHREP